MRFLKWLQDTPMEAEATNTLPTEVMKQIRRIQIRTKRAVDEILAGQYHSVFKGQGMEFRDLREYVPGDDVRLIDWNVTARTTHPCVKLLAEERELTVMLLVDASGSEQFGSVQRLKREAAAEFCALIAFSAIKNNDKVGLMVFTDQVELHIPPRKGTSHTLRVIREILYFKPQGRGTNLADALRYLNNVVKRRAVVFLVSDFMDEGYDKALKTAAKRHDLIAVVVTDPREETLPAVGWVYLQDPETGREIEVNTSDPELREAYAAQRRVHYQDRDTLLKRLGVDTLHLRTDKPFLEELYRFFRMREKRYA